MSAAPYLDAILTPETPPRPGLTVKDAAAEAELQAALDRPKSKATRRRALLTQQALQLRAKGYALIDVAEQLGVSVGTLHAYLSRHRRVVEAARIDDDLDQIALPLAKDNLVQGLLAGNETYTLETLKGRGKLRRFSENKDTGPRELPSLRIEFYVEGGADTAHPSADQTIAGGKACGNIAWPKPKQIAGTVVASKPLTP